jgi:hypothetical protein
MHDALHALQVHDASGAVFGHRRAAEADDVLARAIDGRSRQDHRRSVASRDRDREDQRRQGDEQRRPRPEWEQRPPAAVGIAPHGTCDLRSATPRSPPAFTEMSRLLDGTSRRSMPLRLTTCSC